MPRFFSSDLVIFRAAAELYAEGKPDTTVQNRWDEKVDPRSRMALIKLPVIKGKAGSKDDSSRFAVDSCRDVQALTLIRIMARFVSRSR